MSQPPGPAPDRDSAGPTQSRASESGTFRVVSLVADHSRQWRSGDRERVEDFLERRGETRVTASTLLDLIHNELTLREEDGEAPAIEEYLERFPEQTDEIRTQFELREALRTGATFTVALGSPALTELRDSAGPAALETANHSQPSAQPGGADTADVPLAEEEAPAPAAGASTSLDPAWPRITGFDILDVLGSGGMGTVYRAIDRKNGRRVALKTMNRMGAAFLLRFKREFRTIFDVVHPNLVNLYELIYDGRTWALSMELLEGVDFLKYVRGDAAASSRPSGFLERLREASGQLAQGIQALHQAGRLHRDIKPSNVLVTHSGRVVLLDFGLAAEQDAGGEHQSTEEHLVGTAAYMAPEQAAGLPVSAASDWYSLGVMIFEALTGQVPFHGNALAVLMEKQRRDAPPPAKLVAGIPEDLNALCIALLARRPEDRPGYAEIVHWLAAPRRSSESVQEPPSGTSLSRPGRELLDRLVGRDMHLEQLRDALETTKQGRPAAVFLSGTSGAGKTVLLQSFLAAQSDQPGTVVLAGRCYEHEYVPYKAFDSLIDGLSRHLARLEAADAAALLPRDVASLARAFPGLRRVDAFLKAPRRELEVPDPQELRRRAFTALRELLARMGDRQTLILAIDDLQWGDSDSGALLAELLRPPDAPVLLFLATYRREDRHRSELLQVLTRSQVLRGSAPREGGPMAQADVRELEIEPLDAELAGRLARSLLGVDRSGSSAERDQMARDIARESGGNPFFLAELVRQVQTDELIAKPWQTRDEKLEASGEATGRFTLDRVLWSRIEHLPEEARRALEFIALSGRPLRVAELARCGEFAADERVILASLRAARLIRSTGRAEADEVETYHDRIRETLVAHLDNRLAREHHGRLAAVLEASGQTDPEILGEHLLAAGMPARAGEYFGRAADRAAETLAFERAASLYRRALELGSGGPDPRWSLGARLGDALANAGRGREAAEAYLSAAAELAAPPDEALELRRRAAMQFLISGHIDDGLNTLRSVLAAVGMSLPSTPRRALASLLLRRAMLRIRGLGFRPRVPAAIDAAEIRRIDVCWSASVGLSVVDTVRGADFQARGLLLALRAGEPSRIARALAMEAAHAASLGGSKRKRTERLLRIADDLSRRVEHPYALGMVTLAHGVAAYLEGRWNAAQRSCDEAEAIFRDRCTGVAWELNTSNAFSLWALSHQGQIAELSRRWPVLLARARERGDLYAAMNLSSYLMSIVKLAADDAAAALAGLNETTTRWSREGYHVQHNDALWAAVQIDLYQGDGPSAWRRITRAWPLLRRSLLLRVQFVRTAMLFLRARAALAAATSGAFGGEESAALLAAAGRDARQLRREAMPCPAAYARAIEGALAALRGQPAALPLLRDAIERFDAVDMQLCSAAIRRRLGQLIGGDDGHAEVERSERWMDAQGVRRPDRMTAMILTDLRQP